MMPVSSFRSHPRLYAVRIAALLLTLGLAQALRAQGSEDFQIYVSDERSADVTVIDGATLQPVATIPVGKRPRGIHASADGKRVYVALSGTPIATPKRDASGNLVLEQGKEPAAAAAADRAADGIGIIDVAQRKLVSKLAVGSDPEEFALSHDGRELYISNEDAKSASVVSLTSGKILHVVPIAQEPEGVATSPDGRTFYVTCEAGGDVFAVDTRTNRVVGHFKVPPRPRSVAFLPGAPIAFVPSENTGQLNVVDTTHYKVIRTITLPPGSRPMKVEVSPDGHRIYVSNGRAATVSVLDAHSYELLKTIAVGTRAWGLAVSPDGKYLYTANGPSNDVSVVDVDAGREIKRVKVGDGPWGLTIVRR